MCGILNGAISCVEPTIQCRVAEYYWIVNWKGYGRKPSQPDLMLCQMLLEELGKITGKHMPVPGEPNSGFESEISWNETLLITQVRSHDYDRMVMRGVSCEELALRNCFSLTGHSSARSVQWHFVAAGTYLMKLRSMLKLSNSVWLKGCLSL